MEFHQDFDNPVCGTMHRAQRHQQCTGVLYCSLVVDQHYPYSRFHTENQQVERTQDTLPSAKQRRGAQGTANRGRIVAGQTLLVFSFFFVFPFLFHHPSPRQREQESEGASPQHDKRQKGGLWFLFFSRLIKSAVDTSRGHSPGQSVMHSLLATVTYSIHDVSPPLPVSHTLTPMGGGSLARTLYKNVPAISAHKKTTVRQKHE